MKNIAIIGLGSMGVKYAKMIASDKSLGFNITAITRITPERFDLIKEYVSDDLKIYESNTELFKAYDAKEVEFEAVLIVTPHYSHEMIVCEAFKRGLDVLCDKPMGVYLRQGINTIKENKKNNVYNYIFHQRLYPINKKLKEIVDSKIYGNVKRVSYIVTDWYRVNDYYKSAAWRSTYKTDGGGTLTNQCPHSLDLLCNLFGLPKYVSAFCHEGKYHPIEVEDEVSSYMQWENGMTGVFIASTGENPGVNRLEISFERAVVCAEKGKITISYNPLNEIEYRGLPASEYKTPILQTETITFDEYNTAYKDLIKNFSDCIDDKKTKPVASSYDATLSLYLANAMYLSSWKKKIVSISPLDSGETLEFMDEFEEELRKKCKD